LEKYVSHIKCSKYKPGFAKCDKCSEYNKLRKKQLDEVQKKAALLQFQTHLQEERSEKEQYYAARNKAVQNPDRYLSLITNSMDQRKTCIPFWLNAPKCLGADYSLKNRVIGVIAHGFGTFLYWVTPQLKHDTDLTIECLRSTILKYQKEKGSPPVLYLQMDNASDNKSRRFFSFIYSLSNQQKRSKPPSTQQFESATFLTKREKTGRTFLTPYRPALNSCKKFNHFFFQHHKHKHLPDTDSSLFFQLTKGCEMWMFLHTGILLALIEIKL
jgi:hypothetical protein